MARNWRSLVLFGLLVLVSQLCAAQELQRKWQFAGDFYIFRHPGAIADMKLTSKQVEDVKALEIKFDDAIHAKGIELEETETPEKIWKTFQGMHREHRLKLKDILSEGQWKRFNELSVQIPGANTLFLPHMQEELEFTEQQKQTVAGFARDMTFAYDDNDAEARKNARGKLEEILKKVEAVLTPKQKERFKSMQGKPLKRS